MDPKCGDLRTNIQGHIRTIGEKFRNLVTDPMNMQHGMGQNYGTVATHQSFYRGLLTGYDNMVDQWRRDGCPGDPPGLPSAYRSVPSPAPKPAPPPGSSFDPFSALAPVAGGAAAGAAGYLIYRVVRLVPSLFPPFWPSLPFNLGIP
jgi:hypothetical protein